MILWQLLRRNTTIEGIKLKHKNKLRLYIEYTIFMHKSSSIGNFNAPQQLSKKFKFVRILFPRKTNDSRINSSTTRFMSSIAEQIYETMRINTYNSLHSKHRCTGTFNTWLRQTNDLKVFLVAVQHILNEYLNTTSEIYWSKYCPDLVAATATDALLHNSLILST